jgi:hypothetical protein
MCHFYGITTNQAAIINLFRVINRYVGNLPQMTGVFPQWRWPQSRRRNGASLSARQRVEEAAAVDGGLGWTDTRCS